MYIPEKTSHQNFDQKAKDLLGRLSLEEKCGQLNQHFAGWNSFWIEDGEVRLTEEFEKALTARNVGALYGVHRTKVLENGQQRPMRPEEGARAANELQRRAMAAHPHRIPLIFSEECPKGYLAAGATTFPSPLAYGSSWNPELLRRIGRAIGAETRAGGGHVGYAPILDICHDPRWSRLEEIFGEDPFLAGLLGAEMVRGMQGEGLDRPDAVGATLKHFVAYGATEGGRNTAPAHMGERELREMHMASFYPAVKAGALSLMCSYNEIDGVPVSASRRLLTDLLRGEWGFEGFVVADALSIDELAVGNAENRKHRLGETLTDAAALAARAGVDLSLWDSAYDHLPEAVRSGRLAEEDLDACVLRVLRAKFVLGLFENPFVEEERAARVMGCPEHQELTLDASRQSLILLENNGVLPLKKISRLAVVGPNAHNLCNMLGTYTPDWKTIPGCTVYEGFKQLAPEHMTVEYALGCRVREPDGSGMADAVALAENADAIVAVMGGSSTDREGVRVTPGGQIDLDSVSQVSDIDCGEGIERVSLDLAGRQMELLHQLKATGKPLIVVLIQGRPCEMRWIKENADAVLCAWYPGPRGGLAIAEVLFGQTEPTGRLNLSWPASLGQIPVNYNRRPTGFKRYLEMGSEALYPFGYGLAYTTFTYRNLRLEKPEIALGETLHVSVEVANTGNRAGTAVVQLYLRDEYASVTRPERILRAFQRVELSPGESRTVTLALSEEDLAFWDQEMQFRAEPGEFTVLVGDNSRADLSATFTFLAHRED